MLLKTLSLAGFKSFVDRTHLTFDAGVNVVVGPNGSGKSNLLDALAWVMGTQATRTLRTDRMEDVIFAGTVTRPPVGRAEVSLTLDNTDRFLPLDLEEITLTRRLLRDGTSDYELNGISCRLIDIQELLSDGGVGRHQHALVSQGQIGDILSARPDEHRAVIEEAAGITKYRSRRDRSIRRLERTDIDLARLGDILEQEGRRLRLLKRQANAADRYQNVRADIRQLHLWLGGEQLRSLRSRLSGATSEQSMLEGSMTAANSELRNLVTTLGSMRVAAEEIDLELERDTTAAARIDTLLERFSRIAMVARERRMSLESRLLSTDERRHDLNEERGRLAEELAVLVNSEKGAVELAERREIELHALEDEERLLAGQIQLPGDGLLAKITGDLRALEAAEVRDEREKGQLEQRIELVRERLAGEAQNSEILVSSVQEADSTGASAQNSYRSAEDALELAQVEWEAADADHREQSLQLAEAKACRGAIESALDSEEDCAARDGAISASGVLGAVVDQLDTPAHLTTAVDAVLGGWFSAFVADSSESAAAATVDLKSLGLGGVAFVVSPQSAVDGTAREVAITWDCDALVDQLGPDTDRDLAAALMGDVVLVENWSAGWDLVHRHSGVRAVTLEGDVVTAAGIRLSTPDGSGLVTLEAAGAAVEIAEREMARAESRITTTRRVLDRSRAVERETLGELETVEARLAGLTEALGLNERARSESEAEMERLSSRRGSLEVAAEARTDRITELHRSMDELDEDPQGLQGVREEFSARRRVVARDRDEARRLREEAAATVAGLQERIRMTEHRLAAAAKELDDLDPEQIDPASPEYLEVVENQARQAGSLLRDHLATLREQQRSLRTRSIEADRELETGVSRQRELGVSIAEGKDGVSNLAIELAELHVRIESVEERLRRDADATEGEALAALCPELDEGSDANEILVTLEAQLRRMGPINPLAASEHEELAAYVAQLEEQLADLEESRSELRKVIVALDEEMAVMFMSAFEEISALFQENFDLVFPGGRGSLRLDMPDKPLEAGVEIQAQPLGKKVGRLSLLSGGERSLAALAFLFAVFRARPSPFYVLDEVEAALDDANLRRFVRLVGTLRGTSQLVIITHQPQTMEAADVLYGVTMEPGESSLVVAKHLHAVAV